MIEHIKIENLAHLAPIDFKPGQVNVFIGKNDTGKTLLIKYLYAYAKMVDRVGGYDPEFGEITEYVGGFLSKKDPNIDDNVKAQILDFLEHQFNKEGDLEDKLMGLFNLIKNPQKVKSDIVDQVIYKERLGKNLLGVFQPDVHKGIGELVSRSKTNNQTLSTAIAFQYGTEIITSFSDNVSNQISDAEFSLNRLDTMNSIFIPTKEVISMVAEIIWLRNQYEFRTVFDDTYFDLALELIGPMIKGEEQLAFSEIDELLENALEGRIIRQPNNPSQPFIFQKGEELYNLNVVSEGIKKFGIFNMLLENKSIRPGTILFIDEPETALHPEALRTFIKALFMLADNGVQIFMATHNYFVLKQSELCARESATKYPNVKSALCISLEKEEGKSKLVQPTYHDLKEGMPPNPIVDESLKMFDDDIDLMLGK